MPDSFDVVSSTQAVELQMGSCDSTTNDGTWVLNSSTTTRSTTGRVEWEVTFNVVPERRSRSSEQSHERAKQMLLSLLTESQREQWESDRSIRVVGSKGTEFLIQYGFSWNVFRLDELSNNAGDVERLPVQHYCLHPSGGFSEIFPEEDVVLAQKLLLESDEGEFMRLANTELLVNPLSTAPV